jgi:DNA-binding MarR family transcriptional regulator
VDLHQLDVALARFASLDPARLPIHWPQILVAVALLENPTYEDLERRLNLTNSSVSRSVNGMGDHHRLGGDGLKLLTISRDPNYGRRYRVRLSARGRALVRDLELIGQQQHHTEDK